jgi:N-acetylglutamate synthase-like GNAT family acetyltransferase
VTLDFQLRPARQSDQSTIKAMVRRAQLNPLQLNWRRFTVAVDSADHILGCVQQKPHRDGTHELASLVVAHTWRGHGIATALVEFIQDNAQDDLWLMCRRSLAPFYESFGFYVVDEPSEMGTYYRRIWWLVRIWSFVSRQDVHLAIMRWHAQRTDREGRFVQRSEEV